MYVFFSFWTEGELLRSQVFILYMEGRREDKTKLHLNITVAFLSGHVKRNKRDHWLRVGDRDRDMGI